MLHATRGTGIQTEVSHRDDQYGNNEYAHIHNWLFGEQPRLADACARTPHMAELMTDVATMTERYTDLHEIDPRSLDPYVICTPQGQIIIDLHGTVSVRNDALQRRHEQGSSMPETMNGQRVVAEGLQIIPNGNRVVVEVLKPKDKSHGGILIPETAKDAPQEGVIVAAGDGLENKNLKVGDHVIFSKFSGAETTIDTGRYLILSEHHVIATIVR